MTVHNRELDQIKSSATTKDLVDAIKALDLESIPFEKRAMAIREQVARVMFALTTDPKERMKPHFLEAERVYLRRVLGSSKRIVL